MIGTGTTGFATQGEYDRLNRLRAIVDARNGLTTLDYDGADRLTSVTDPRTLTTAYPRTGLGEATAVGSPDTGLATMTHDAEGNLLSRTDSRGVLASYTHDALNRLTQVVYSKAGQPSQTIGWTYDQTGAGFSHGIGRLTSTSHANGSSRYAYDAQGRLVTATQTITAASGANSANVVHSVGYGYTAGNLTSITYPSGRVASFGYANGKPTAVRLAQDAGSTPVDLLTGIQYQPFGPIAAWNWHYAGGPQASVRTFDTTGRLIRHQLGQFMRDISYDAADRISAFTHYEIATGSGGAPASWRNQAFAYDELNRLSTYSLGASNWTISYDPNGNRTGTTLNGASTRTYTTEPSSNRLMTVTNPLSTYTYDVTGNVVALGMAVGNYDLSGRWASMAAGGGTLTFTHNALGQRVRKYTNGGASSVILFVYDQQGQLLGEYDSTGAALREYIWLGNTPVAMFMPAGPGNPPNMYFIQTDHIDTPRVVVERNGGAVRWMWLSEAFGSSAAEDNPTGLGAFTLPLRFPGQYFDMETGTHYNYFRDYDPWAGRYLQSDPIGLNGGMNTYTYVDGDPLTGMDPRGLANSAATKWMEGWAKPKPRPPFRADGLPWGAGCGDARSDAVVPDFFSKSCSTHDACYADCDGPSKAVCDIRFLGNMLIESRYSMPMTSGIYYGGVMFGGDDAFKAARAKCVCTGSW